MVENDQNASKMSYLVTSQLASLYTILINNTVGCFVSPSFCHTTKLQKRNLYFFYCHLVGQPNNKRGWQD